MNFHKIFNLKSFIIAAIFVLVLICAVAVRLYFAPYDNRPILTLAQKQAMVEYAYKAIAEQLIDEKISEEFGNFEKKYSKIFVTFLDNGEIRCCQGGYFNDSEKTVKDDLDKAIKNCVDDKRFNNAEASQTGNFSVVIDALYNEQAVVARDIDGLKMEIELGINAIKISKGSKSAYYKASVPIEKNYSLKTTLEKLCSKAGLSKNCYKDSKTNITKFDSISFVSDKLGNIKDLYRGSIFINADDISKKDILNSITIGYKWMENDIEETTGLLKYEYYPSSNSYSKDNNYVRGMAGVWMAAKTSQFLNNNDKNKIAINGLDYYLSFAKEKNNGKYIKIDSAKLSYNAFAVLTLVDNKDYPDRGKLIKELSQGILNAQRNDGSFSTNFEQDSNSSIDYYPGEAMLALMNAYFETGEEKYSAAVEKAFPYYSNYWRNNKNTAFIPWQTQTYVLLYQKTGNKELVDFVFEMNDWLVDNYQNDSSYIYADYVGGFKSIPGSSTSAYLEGLADAYSLAVKIGDSEHIKKYKLACKLATRFVMQTQFTKDNLFYITNKERTLGGFKSSLVNNSIRVDNAQHSLSALMKVYQSDIFKN